MTIFWQYKLFVDIGRLFRRTVVKPEWGGWNWRICCFPDVTAS